MAHGLIIRHPITGQELLNSNTYITRVIATSVNTGITNGSFDTSFAGSGTPAFHINDFSLNQPDVFPPEIWVDGQLIRWSFSENAVDLPSANRKSSNLTIFKRS